MMVKLGSNWPWVWCSVVFIFCRCERLEEQLNDLTELHQNEILNLKQELASMEEKIAYQSYERARDIQVNKWTHQLCSGIGAVSRLCRVCPTGGAGGLSDAHLQDGAAAAATAGGAAGGFGECHSKDSPWKTNQRAARCHGSSLSVCFHSS